MHSTELTAQRAFSRSDSHPALVEDWLGVVLKAWDVPSASTARWLAPARDVLERSDPLVVLAQYDATLLLFTLEISRSGKTVYGIDDWLGYAQGEGGLPSA